MRRDPVIGENYPGTELCTRTVPGGVCGKPGAWHVVWSGHLSSIACLDCAEDIRRGYRYRELHRLVKYCTHPVALWYPDEYTCRPPKDGADIPRGVFLLGR